MSERWLARDDVRVPLTDKGFDTLAALVRRRGRLATKEELLAEVWPGTFVEENNLDKSISAIRQALGEKASAPQYIETIRGRGYRFLPPVTEVPDTGISISAGDSRPAARNGDVRQVRVLAAGGLLLTLGIAVGIWIWIEHRPVRSEAPSPRSIAVLPFKPVASGERDESLEIGIADTLITKLSALRVVTVRPIGAVRKFASLEQDPVAAGRELNVEAVLEGTLQRANERIRATLRLTRVADGTSLWAGTFDERFADIFSVQDSIAEQVTGALRVRLSDEQHRRLARRDTDSTDAYGLYLKGRDVWNRRTQDGIEKSIGYFREAIALDPRYALAYAGLADSYAISSDYGSASARQSLLESKRAAMHALEIDDQLAEAHTSLAFVSEALEWDWARAEAEYRRALDLDPNYANAHHRYGMFLCWMARFPQALDELARASRLDPTSLIISADRGLALFLARRYDEAAEQLRKTIELDRDFARAHVYLADCYVQQRKYSDASAEVELASRNSTPDRADILRAYVFAAAGRAADARRLLDSPSLRNRASSVQPLYVAAAHAVLGENVPAFHVLDEAVQQRAIGVLRLGVDPKLDALRTDPRFGELLERTGLRSAGVR